MEYTPGHNLHKLRYAWSLEWESATRYPSEDAALERAKELGVENFIVDTYQRRANPV